MPKKLKKRHLKNKINSSELVKLRSKRSCLRIIIKSSPSTKSVADNIIVNEDCEMSDSNDDKVVDSEKEENDSSEKDGSEKSASTNFELKPNSTLGTYRKGKKHQDVKFFKCDYCDFESKYRHNLVRHIDLKRCPNQPHFDSNETCVVTEIKKANFHSLPLSVIIILICNKRNLAAELLKCSECCFETENLKCLELHSQIHAEVQKCPECSNESTDTEAFKDHLITHLDQFTNKNEPHPYSFRKRLRPFKKTVTVIESSDDEESKNSDENKTRDSDFEEEKIDNDKEDTSNNYQTHRRKKFKCSDCSFETKFKGEYSAHCLVHQNVELFKCDYCDFESKYRQSLIRHIDLKRCPNQHEFDSDESCDSIEDENTEFHLLPLSDIITLICNRNSAEELLKCSECSFETENLKCLELHSQIHAEVQKCPECSNESTDTEGFKDHLITHLDHSTNKNESHPYSFRKRLRQSNKTDFELSDDEQSKNSNKNNTQDFDFGEENVERKKFKCSDCSFETKFKGEYIVHCLVHQNVELFKCDYCDFESKYRHNLKRHIDLERCPNQHKFDSYESCAIIENENTKFHSLPLSEIIILICNKRNSLDENTSVPASAELLKCSECSFETENSKCLELHSEIHAEVQKCPECSNESTDTEVFKDHLITHLDHCTSMKRPKQSNKIETDQLSDEEAKFQTKTKLTTRLSRKKL